MPKSVETFGNKETLIFRSKCLLMIFCVLSKCTLVANNTRCVPGVCRIAWDYWRVKPQCFCILPSL